MDPLADLVDPDDREAFTARLALRQRGVARGDRYEFAILARQGRRVELEVAIKTTDRQEPPLSFAIVRDISERRAVEKLKDEFVSIISHEMRTPLTSIRGSLGLLASGKLGDLPPKAERLLTIAANNAERLARLINDVLDLERMEAGTSGLVYSRVDLGELLDHAVEVVRSLADRAQVQLEVSAVAGQVRVDVDRVVQLLTNLLSNAIKFSPPGGAIRLVAELQGDECRIEVTDQGRGIPGEKLESIFGRFQQVDASDSRQKGGTGLGLTICRSIAQQHGGRIWAESVQGQGSTFIVALPAGGSTPAQGKDS